MRNPQLWLLSDRQVSRLHPAAVRPLLLVVAVALAGFAAVAIVVTVTGGADVLDTFCYRFTEPHRSATGVAVAQVVTAFGSYQFVLALTASFAIVTMIQSRRLLEPIALLVSAPFTASLVLLIKLALGRARPPSALLLGEAPTDYSFPSGHTTSGTVLFLLSTFVITSMVGRLAVRRILQFAGITVAVLIGCSRVYLGCHWASDVIAGWFLASALVGMILIALIAVASLRTEGSAVTGVALGETTLPPGELLGRTRPGHRAV